MNRYQNRHYLEIQMSSLYSFTHIGADISTNQTRSLLMELPCHIGKTVNKSIHKTINFKWDHEKGAGSIRQISEGVSSWKRC